MLSSAIRADLVDAVRDDLIGPEPESDQATETLSRSPSSWYLAGFLAPTGQPLDEKEDETAEEELTSAADSPEEGEPEAPAARRPMFPSSIGLTVLVRATTTALKARVTYGTYAPRPAPATAAEGQRFPSQPPPSEREGAARVVWVREPHDHEVTITIGSEGAKVAPPLPKGITLRVVPRPVPPNERGLTEVGTRYVTVFLVNERTPVPKPEQDAGFMFQAQVALECAEGFVPRPNLRGAHPDDDLDEQIGDLQYRDAFEYAVGHGVAVKADVIGRNGDVFCSHVETCWMPTAEVEKVVPSTVEGVELRMAALAELADGAAVHAALDKLVTEYRAWLEVQTSRAEGELTTPTRKQTARSLLNAAGIAATRIENGIRVIADEPRALAAFRLANRAMAAQARAPRRVRDKTAADEPAWYPFQLAFLLMNVAAQLDPEHPEREAVDLIFFPTGGGKTEAYLGLAAFTLALRRLSHAGLGSAGVTVLMRYTLRLLTLDQLERAATLICALEIERRRDPQALGAHRFSIGLWVGKSATPNRFGTDKDRDDSTARARVLAFAKDPRANPSPVPIDKCPWCGEPFNQDTFQLEPTRDVPMQLRIRCTSPRCEFKWRKEHPEGIPVLAVDDEIYRELPCFLIATVDKFAGLPWVGKTGLLLGCNVTHHNALGFHGPGQMPPDARALPQPLLPPDVIIQDELHLISGPLGTMVGLYETAIDYLASRDGQKGPIRPKIVASTATVRRAQPQIRALFGRSRVEVFPPPGPDRRRSFFAETVAPSKANPKSNARLYVGIAAPGRSQKVLLMRTYMVLLSAAKKAFDQDPAAADPYMTLVGYFNSLRELAGSRRIVEEEVRDRLLRLASRRRVGEGTPRFVNRAIELACVELTSRESTDKVKIAKERLAQDFLTRSKTRAPVDVALASNMISVGLDITRLGLMVVCGQPKTSAEYIQATSRVGRDAARPGLVITMLNVHKPRDRSHLEHFTAYHESFYRGVEAASVTPFSPRAIDRGLAGVAVALARLKDPRLTAPDGANAIGAVAKDELDFIGDVLAARVEAHRMSEDGDDPIDDVKAGLRRSIAVLLDSWARVAMDDRHKGEGLAYQRFEDGQSSKRPLLRMPLDRDLAECDQHERRFTANRSMREVEGSVDVYVTTLKQSGIALEAGK
jgi:hypothetical protein